MATFRRACSKITEKGDESSEKVQCYNQTLGEDDQENSFDRTSSVVETDEEVPYVIRKFVLKRVLSKLFHTIIIIIFIINLFTVGYFLFSYKKAN